MKTSNGILGAVSVPPLQSGDRLTWPEFARRYDAMPNRLKAELIDGVVFMASPVSQRYHGNPHFNLIGWLSAYQARTRGVEGGDNATCRCDDDNAPQPDALLFILPECGGQVRLDNEGYVVAAPEWAGEIAASSVSLDLHEKLDLYKRFGVREYLVWRVYDRAIDWFVLRGGAYRALRPSPDGIYRSKTLSGLWLDPVALIDGNMPRVLEVVEQGIASPDHAAFVARLERRHQKGKTPSPRRRKGPK
jgi:Uma2 family endonuclease